MVNIDSSNFLCSDTIFDTCELITMNGIAVKAIRNLACFIHPEQISEINTKSKDSVTTALGIIGALASMYVGPRIDARNATIATDNPKIACVIVVFLLSNNKAMEVATRTKPNIKYGNAVPRKKLDTME